MMANDRVGGVEAHDVRRFLPGLVGSRQAVWLALVPGDDLLERAPAQRRGAVVDQDVNKRGEREFERVDCQSSRRIETGQGIERFPQVGQAIPLRVGVRARGPWHSRA